jgi:coproporphyrinogen III oxidase-like Fe-S oxidoreductase
MTGLRSSKGINREYIRHQWGEQVLGLIEIEMVQSLQTGKLIKTDDGWKLSEEGKFFADGIASSLFIVD